MKNYSITLELITDEAVSLILTNTEYEGVLLSADVGNFTILLSPRDIAALEQMLKIIQNYSK